MGGTRALKFFIRELDDLLLMLVHKAAEGSQQDVLCLEDVGHVRRRNWTVSGVDCCNQVA